MYVCKHVQIYLCNTHIHIKTHKILLKVSLGETEKSLTEGNLPLLPFVKQAVGNLGK
jgi:hypothetical protein